MKDAVNDTVVLDKLSSRLSKLTEQMNAATQRLQLEFEKASQVLEGESFNDVRRHVENAVVATDEICSEIKEAQRYLSDLKKTITEYERLKF